VRLAFATLPRLERRKTVSDSAPSECSIIVVEDDESEALLLKRAFQAARVKNPVLLFGDGQALMDYLSRLGTDDAQQISDAPPGLILMDLKTPRTNGLEALAWVRAQPVLKRLVVVMMSSSDYPGDINRAYDLGCNSYLLKPISLDRLVEMVKLLDSYWLRTNEIAATELQTTRAPER
jgi:CheY-like chemotaxis protein